jgi:hypothetical protein
MEGLSGGWSIGVVVGSILRRLLFGGGPLLLETVVKREHRKTLTRSEWEQITSSRPVLRWVLERRPNSERSGVSEGRRPPQPPQPPPVPPDKEAS